jgi:hypothetical protein
VETDSGKVVRGLKSTYKRHGTLNLFAALEVDTGQVHTKFTEYKKREDFRGFLNSVLADQPQDRTSMSSSITIPLISETTTGWQSSKDESGFTSRRLRPVG